MNALPPASPVRRAALETLEARRLLAVVSPDTTFADNGRRDL